MKYVSCLCAVLAFVAFTACAGLEEKETKEKSEDIMICGNIGAPCLKDHSCCIIQKEASYTVSEELPSKD